MSRTKTRTTQLETALLLYQQFSRQQEAARGSSFDDRREDELRERAEQAAFALADFRRSRGFRAALDAVLPGWVDVDASEHLPQNLWYSFVSDSPVDWLDWLVENGVKEETAQKLVTDAFASVKPVEKK